MLYYPVIPSSYLIEPTGNGSLVGDGPVVAVWTGVPPLTHSHHEVPESLLFVVFSSPIVGCYIFWGMFKKEQFIFIFITVPCFVHLASVCAFVL